MRHAFQNGEKNCSAQLMWGCDCSVCSSSLACWSSKESLAFGLPVSVFSNRAGWNLQHDRVAQSLSACDQDWWISDQDARTMGKEQDLLQAVKNGDLPSAQKLLAKVKANRSSECSCLLHVYIEMNHLMLCLKTIEVPDVLFQFLCIA